MRLSALKTSCERIPNMEHVFRPRSYIIIADKMRSNASERSKLSNQTMFANFADSNFTATGMKLVSQVLRGSFAVVKCREELSRARAIIHPLLCQKNVCGSNQLGPNFADCSQLCMSSSCCYVEYYSLIRFRGQ